MTAPLLLWTIYRRPRDMPHAEFVVRPHAVDDSGTRPLLEHHTAQTLEEARAKVPPGLVCLARDPTDEPHIVETWV